MEGLVKPKNAGQWGQAGGRLGGAAASQRLTWVTPSLEESLEDVRQFWGSADNENQFHDGAEAREWVHVPTPRWTRRPNQVPGCPLNQEGSDTGWNAGPQAVYFQSRATPPTLVLEPGRPPEVGAGMCHLPGPMPECAQHISECPRRAFIRWPHRSGLAYPDLYLKVWLVPGSWGSLSSPPLARLSLYITKASLTKACSL